MADSDPFQPSSEDPSFEWYTYMPLHNEQRAPSDFPSPMNLAGGPRFRLMILHPGTASDSIRCSLAVMKPISDIMIFDRDRKPRDITYYEALSYTWGDVSKNEQIICDGKLLKITESLAVALRVLRRPETSRTLWADGICINQQDMEEKANQVLLMSSIFSLAAQVICWLGPDDDGHANFVFQLAERLATKFKLDSYHTNGMAIIDTPNVFRQQAEHLHKVITTVSDGEESFLVTIFASLEVYIAPMLRRPWFSRMWIRQEIGYASKAVVLCGNNKVDAKALHWLIEWAVYIDELLGAFVLPNGSINAFTSYGHSPKMSLLDVLVRCRNWKSTDPRDKIFALLSHPKAWSDEPFPGEKDYCASFKSKINAGWSSSVRIWEFAFAHVEAERDLQKWLLADPHRQCPSEQDMSQDPSSAEAGVSNSAAGQSDSLASQISSAHITGSLDNQIFRWLALSCCGDVLGGEAVLSRAKNNNSETQRHIVNAFSQARRLNEIVNPRLHPVYRAAKGAEILTATAKPIMKPDYQKSLDDVNKSLAIEFLRINQREGLHLLCVVQHSDSTAQTFGNGVSSWVPEWEHPDVYCHIGLHAQWLGMFRAFGDHEGEMNITVSPPTLTLAGIFLDTITAFSKPVQFDMSAESEACLELWQLIIRFSASSHTPSDLERLQLFCRLLTAHNFECASPSFHHQLLDDDGLFQSFTTFWSELYMHVSSTSDSSGPSSTSNIFPLPAPLEANQHNGGIFWKLALLVSRNRRVFSTAKGYLGIGPQILQKDDMVCIFPGVPVPLILRPEGEHFLLVGESYVDGIMHGEAVDPTKIRQFHIR